MSLLVDARLLGVGEQDHDDVGFLAGLGDREDAQPRFLGFAPRRRPFAQPDAHVDARLLEVQGMGVSLRPVSEHRDLARVEERESASLS